MWMARYKYGKRMGVVRLAPGKTHDPIKKVRRKSSKAGGCGGDGYCYSVPLYDPVVSLGIEDLQKKRVMARARESLRVAISHDRLNISHRHLGVPYTRWPHNEPPLTSKTNFGRYYVVHNSTSKDAKKAKQEQLMSLLPLVVSLALTYKHAKIRAAERKALLDKLRGVLSLFHRKQVPGFVRAALPELFVK